MNDSNGAGNNAHMNEQLMNRPPPPAAHTNLLHMAGNNYFLLYACRVIKLKFNVLIADKLINLIKLIKKLISKNFLSPSISLSLSRP